MQLFDNDDNDDYNVLPTSPTTTTTTTTHPSTDHSPPHHKKQWLKANSKNPKRQPQKRKQSPSPHSPPKIKKLTSSFFLLPKKNSNPNRKQLGARIIKPSKSSSALKTAQFKKKHSSGMTALTEKSLASRAGHLELLKGGKREKRVELARKALEGEGGKGGKK